MVWFIVGFLVGLDAPADQPAPIDPCPECRADRTSLKTQVQALRSATRSNDRVQAAKALASVRWPCHPEVVAALAEALRDDKKPKVRVAAAQALHRLVANLPTSHLALQVASRSDPESSVRKQAKKALEAKGLRCVLDCPICGLVPKNGAITGPSVLLPEWGKPTEKSGAQPDEPKPTSSLPPALPEAVP